MIFFSSFIHHIDIFVVLQTARSFTHSICITHSNCFVILYSLCRIHTYIHIFFIGHAQCMPCSKSTHKWARPRIRSFHISWKFTIKFFIHNRYQNINFVVFYHMHVECCEREMSLPCTWINTTIPLILYYIYMHTHAYTMLEMAHGAESESK